MKFSLAVVLSIPVLWAGDPAATQIQAAATKAVALIQRSQKTWYAKQSCVSCHQQVFPALAFQAARAHGIAVDEAAAHSDATAAFGYFSNLERAVEYTHIIDPALDDGYSLIAARASGMAPSLVTALYARPPESYSAFTATAVSLRAVQLYAHATLKADTEARMARARAWLVSHQ